MDPATVHATLKALVNGALRDSADVSIWDITTKQVSKPKALQAAYFRTLVKFDELRDQTTHSFADELQLAAYGVALASMNRVQVDIDTSRYAAKTKPKDPVADLGVISEFQAITDRQGDVVVWNLPGIILPSRVNAYNEACKAIRETLGKRLGSAQRNEKDKKSWRWKGFRRLALLGSGRMTLSPGYFMVGHTGRGKPLKQSNDTKLPGAMEWLSAVCETELLIGAIASVTCPDMIRHGMECVKIIETQKLAGDKLPLWPSPFNCIELLVNRATALHRDSGGGWSMHDLLASFGIFHDALLTIHDLGASIPFPPGSLILLLSKVFAHSANWANGERICVAHFMKDEVHERVGLPSPKLPGIGSYLSLIGQRNLKRKRGCGEK